MMRKTMLNRRQLVGWILGALLVSVGPCRLAQADVAAAPAAWLTEAARRLDNAPVLRGDFEQTKTIKGFKKPLISRGHFLMARGKGIQWVTAEPFPSTLVVTKDRLLTIMDKGVQQQLDARQEPGLRAINELLLAVLGGDLNALNARFQIDGGLQGAQGWRLTLVPRDATLLRFISRIEMDGDRHVQHVRLSEGSGDESRIQFTHQSSTSLGQAEAERFN